jgi:hypothetical protein
MGRVSKIFGRLIERMPDGIKIMLSELTPEEKQFRDLTKKGKSMLEISYDPGRINWTEYMKTMEESRNVLNGYNGRFKKYFEDRISLLDYKEKLVCGYLGHD